MRPGFVYRLRRREAVFSPTEHFGCEADARAKLESLLRAWELSTALQHQRGVLEFNFLSAQIQREAPRPAVLELQGAAIAISGASAILALTFEGRHQSGGGSRLSMLSTLLSDREIPVCQKRERRPISTSIRADRLILLVHKGRYPTLLRAHSDWL